MFYKDHKLYLRKRFFSAFIKKHVVTFAEILNGGDKMTIIMDFKASKE